MDVNVATGQYEEAMLWCQREFSSNTHLKDLLSFYNFTAYHNNAPYHSKRNLRLMCEVAYGKLSKAQHEVLFRKHAEASVAISAQNATTSTCPVYASLLSLALTVVDGLRDQRVLCMAYGSGCAASMFGLETTGAPIHASDVLTRLRERQPASVEDALLLVDAFEMTHRRFGFEPVH